MPPDTPGTTRRDDFLVGDWLAEPALCRLSKDGVVVRLRPQLMDLLVCLAGRPGRVISKEDILAEVWPGQFIAESGLSRCVAELRQAFHDDPHRPAFIETIAKRGYRLIAPVSPITPVSTASGGLTPPDPGTAATDAAPIAAVPSESHSARVRRRLRQHWVGLAVVASVAAVILAVAVLRTPALGETDSVVLCFDNQTGEAVFDGTLQLALTVQLEQSPFLRVVSDEQVRDSLRLMGRDPGLALTRPLAVEVCRRQGARAMIAGSIGRVASRYVLGLEGIACESGEVLAREQAQAGAREAVLDVLGGMVPPLRRRLGESLASVARHAVPVTQATTSSLEALSAASLGDLERRRGRYEAAAAHYRRAVAVDPSFALAYTRLGSVVSWLGRSQESEASVRKAFALRERTSLPERLEIEARYYRGVTGDLTAAIAALDELRQSYPRSSVARSGLAQVYAAVGRYGEALIEAREAARLEPAGNRENVQLARSYLYLNRFDEAKQVAEAAVARGNDAFDLHGVLFDCAFAKGDANGVAREMAWATTAPDATSLFLVFEAEASVYAGKLRLARQRLSEVQALSREQGDGEGAVEFRLIEAAYEALYGRPAEARTMVEDVLGTPGAAGPEALFAAAALALGGETDAAQRVVDTLDRAATPGERRRVLRTSVLAAVESARGAHARAIAMLAPHVPIELGLDYLLVPAVVRAQANLRGGNLAPALAAFESIVAHNGLDPSSEMLPIARLGIARAHALAGRVEAARTAYDGLLRLWAEADADLPILLTARQERQRLQ